LTVENGRFAVQAGERRFETENVVVAMSNFQRPTKPWFAGALDPSIRQLHSAHYRSPSQLQEGPVLLVGAGNSGADIAMELSSRHEVWMSGRDVGEIPFNIDGLAGRHLLVRLVLKVVFHRVLTVRTPFGRKARPKFLSQGGPLVRLKRRDLDRAGVMRVPRTRGVERGLPVLEDGRVLEPANVIWCTGFDAGFDWIDVPGVSSETPEHASGIVEHVPGLYFVGLNFLHSVSSTMVHGVGRDAARIVNAIAAQRQRGVQEGVPRTTSEVAM
jgi:putative flavoprotein involved in K+ transport